jgi:voltage-gated potassium channel
MSFLGDGDNTALKSRILAFEERRGRFVNNILAMFSAVYLADYSWQVLSQPEGLQNAVAEGISTFVYCVFALDVVYRLFEYFARSAEKRNMRRFIVSMILPVLALFAPTLRALRIFRLLLTLRGFVGLVKNRAESAALLVFVSFPLIAYTSALAILDAERGVTGANILSLKDALWWSLVTMTTVGYGDHFPVSDEGKLIASGLLLCGIVIFSSITAIVSTWILAERKSGNSGIEEQI